MAQMLSLARRHRGYLVFSTTTIAASVGVNLIVFTIVNALWLRPLPVSEPDRLVVITGYYFENLEAPVLKAFRDVAGQCVLDGSVDALPLHPRLAVAQVPNRLETLCVTPEYFKIFGVPIRGRDFRADDNSIGSEPVAIISDRLWTTELGRRPDVIGATLAAEPFPVRIIGVATAGFQGARRGERVDIWIPNRIAPRLVSSRARPSSVPLMVFGRISDGHTFKDAERRVQEVIGRDPFMAQLTLVPLKNAFGTPESRTIVVQEENALALVAGLAMLVLIGGCATLAALALVHYERRRPELAMRIALGVSRTQLIRQLASELGIMVGVGITGAILVAYWGVRAIPSLALPGGVDLGRLDLSIDWRVIAVASITTLVTYATAAWVPVASFTRAELATALLAGSNSTPAASSQRMRQTFLAVHVCASIVVLVAAGLFVRTVMRAYWTGPGFNIDDTVFVTVRVAPPLHGGTLESWRQTAAGRTARIREAFQSLPGVTHVAEGVAPIGLDATRRVGWRTINTVHGQRNVLLGTMFGSPELLSALGVPLLAGRGLVPGDASSIPKPAVLTESLARMLWHNENPLGQVFSLHGREGGPFLIVGVAEDIVFGSFNGRAAGVVFSTKNEAGLAMDSRFVIRTAYPAAIQQQIERLIRDTMADAPTPTVARGVDLLMRDLGRQRLGAWFFAGFGLAALLIGLGGTFGLVAYLAESRQREFGVRLALGARPHDLVRHGVGTALVPVSIGLAMGLALAAVVSRVLASSLAGVSTLDVGTYVVVAIVVLSSAAGVALGAAWRLTRVMPIDALRTN